MGKRDGSIATRRRRRAYEPKKLRKKIKYDDRAVKTKKHTDWGRCFNGIGKGFLFGFVLGGGIATIVTYGPLAKVMRKADADTQMRFRRLILIGGGLFLGTIFGVAQSLRHCR